MRSTHRVNACARLALFVTIGMAAALLCPTASQSQSPSTMTDTSPTSTTLSARQQAIIPIAALAAAGDLPRLGPALNRGLDAGLTINEVKEVLIQLYAYAGFPRSLNAIGELKKTVEERQQRGLHDAEGAAPKRAIPKGDALLAAGTVNQTQLVGKPVSGPLFDFAPAIGEYLQTHLFGDIFERDNLDWRDRELATVSMLAAMQGVDSQLQAHFGMAVNVGLTADQLHQLVDVLATRVDAAFAARAREALARSLGTSKTQ